MYCLLRLIVEAEVEAEGGWERVDVEGRWDDKADMRAAWYMECWELHVAGDDCCPTLVSVVRREWMSRECTHSIDLYAKSQAIQEQAAKGPRPTI